MSAPIQTQIQVFRDVYDVLNEYANKLYEKLREELEKRYDLNEFFVDIVDATNETYQIVVEAEIILREVQRIYYEGIEESCSEGVRDAVARGEVPEEEAEKYFEECVEETVAEHDAEYGEKPFEFVFRDHPKYVNVEAYVDTIASDTPHYRSYLDVLIVRRYINIGKSFVEHVYRSQDTKVLEKVVSYDVEQIIGLVDRLYRAVMVLLNG